MKVEDGEFWEVKENLLKLMGNERDWKVRKWNGSTGNGKQGKGRKG